MSLGWRFLLFLYNLIFLGLAGAVLAGAAGRPEPMHYANLLFSTPENRILSGVCALVLIVVFVYIMLRALIPEKKPKTVVIDQSLNGQVLITIEAVKVIIMKAVRQVEGVKEIKPAVRNSNKGLLVYLHMMINPECSVPEITEKVKDTVKRYLEELGGLKVAEVRILVDDLGTAGNKQLNA
ncbi:Uncharacterized conserved protein YloU, alkaline shock protein (Asp23) family [Thermosyntropha lipolytica DSM 11003]|uniref:Uncharacterized conserved protein YloU, alkaline shock protein (Asp23) family n=1 Tax=Thermosyntropha lipolytica DSM 11003 TaxID=1123382 RepID=A0A1M5LJ29_9FIRM|nr:alkaline shock response membrane anchor protein AmaP [Thermosyntropha lipolytica]SHG65047.1 Uncharacterized conserved protein YloU, alkaline shock protein (Asp23) family [Thermosyntropha lipolytica DSM 11003]